MNRLKFNSKKVVFIKSLSYLTIMPDWLVVKLPNKLNESVITQPYDSIKANCDDHMLELNINKFYVGMDILNKAINKLTSKGDTWKTILIEISVSNIRITDCTVRSYMYSS